ncbi:uncharacterized protein [Labrus bergylta]|uniref:uncharacterized protein n=1 Tax=Labrus bergylta TaxID=56723 RepID=UPI003313EE6A
MGSTGSRPRLHKVAPCSLQEEGDKPKPQWTLPALPVSVEQPSESLGHTKRTLPPLKQEISLSTLSEPRIAGNFPPKQSNHSSIIHSHPPRRPQALQPLDVQIGQPSNANQIAMGRGCRDGGVQQFSITRRNGPGRMTQAGFLEAQTALTQQDQQQQRAQLRQARELRRRKVVYTVKVGNTGKSQGPKLVRRPTERDIFWDETTGDRLDLSCFLDQKSLPHLGLPCNQLRRRGRGVNQRDQAQGSRNK